jgi:hypothetical protein
MTDMLLKVDYDLLGHITFVQFEDLTIAHSADEFLAHFGVKGMKWGVRKDAALRGTSSVHAAHEDAIKAQAAKEKVKVGGVKALSNEELQALVTRQNLEQNFARLNPKQVSAGKNFANTVSQIGANSIKNTTQKTADKALQKGADALINKPLRLLPRAPPR